MDDIARQAISSALSGNWEDALKFNEMILQESPDNTDAMVRMARAFIELGNMARAKKILDKVIKIDPYNTIANKALLKIKGAVKAGEVTHNRVRPGEFLEEPGRTKLTELTHLGDPNIILQLDPGDEAKMVTGGRTVSINTLNDKHIGRLPDDLGFRLKKLISEGFEFQALIKSSASDCVRVFIKEVAKPAGSEKVMSFPIEKEEISDDSGHEQDDEDSEY